MAQNYNQLRAMWAVTKGSLTATFRSPQSVFFSLFFPIVLIWIFGALGGNGTPSVNVAFEKNSDTTTILYQYLKHYPVLHFTDPKKKNIEEELKKGRITAIIDVIPVPDSTYVLNLKTSTASQRDLELLRSVLKTASNDVEKKLHPNQKEFATVKEALVYRERPYRMIDFFLPGMIGFSLIGSAVFGISFVFYSLRETLVLKRMYSTPIKREYILLGESISRVVFNLLTVVVLIAFGYYAYHFTLANGLITFVEMLAISFIALLVFMGFGFFIASVSKNQNVIPIYANLFMFPQYFLSGTFFPRSALPAFLQPVLKFLPLTAVNDAMRNVAFEGASLASCWEQILILAGWGVIIYLVTARVFRWE
jgi:ABC-2 type transport system permease protein